MKNKVPTVFLEDMEKLLGKEEFKEFLQGYSDVSHGGLRVNTLKISIEEFRKIAPFSLESVPWSDDGFYYTGDISAGKHPYYHAGLYYIQEPSAMLPAVLLKAGPGEKILDLCAAPGGKTVKIAADMENTGFLAANDISPKRIKPLIKNIELAGIKNTLVFNEDPQRLSVKYPLFFDRILVDAPCSGQGMFRKDPTLVSALTKNYNRDYPEIQAKLLEYAHMMLKPGGRMVYSTCTFNPDENENIIAGFLKKHREYEILKIPLTGGMENGRCSWLDEEYKNDMHVYESVADTIRIWPHRARGEGHFAAVLIKNGGSAAEKVEMSGGINYIPPEIHDFFKTNIRNNIIETGNIGINRKAVSYFPGKLPDYNGLRVFKTGWFLGTLEKYGFEPAQALYMGLCADDLNSKVDLRPDSIDVLKYLKGETLVIECVKGYLAVCIDGYVLGFAKSDGNHLKNCYPPGWRITRE